MWIFIISVGLLSFILGFASAAALLVSSEADFTTKSREFADRYWRDKY